MIEKILGCPECGGLLEVAEPEYGHGGASAHCSLCGFGATASDHNGLAEMLHHKHMKKAKERREQKRDDALNNLFTHHPPKGDQVERYQKIREAGKELATLIEEFCPPGIERTEALLNVRQAVMWANAAIACNE